MTLLFAILLAALPLLVPLLRPPPAQAAWPTSCGQVIFKPTQEFAYKYPYEVAGIHWSATAPDWVRHMAVSHISWEVRVPIQPAGVYQPQNASFTTIIPQSNTFGGDWAGSKTLVETGAGKVFVFFEVSIKAWFADDETLEIKEVTCGIPLRSFSFWIRRWTDQAPRSTPVPGTTPTPAQQCSQSCTTSSTSNSTVTFWPASTSTYAPPPGTAVTEVSINSTLEVPLTVQP